MVQHKHYLNELYPQYRKGVYNRSEFEGLVYQYFIKHQNKTYLTNWEHDKYEDFLSWFYPRLRKSIDSYREEKTFDSYINSVVYTASKEYRNRTMVKTITEYSAWSVHVPEFYVQNESPPYSYEMPEKPKLQITNESLKKNPKQILALILKCYFYVSDDFLDRIVCPAGIDKEELLEMVNKLRTLRKKKDDALYFMKERVYSQYYRCIVYEKRLSYAPEGTIVHQKLQERLCKARQRLERMRSRVGRVRTDASNRQIAGIIGVSKGTVDSALCRFKSKWEPLADKAMLN